MHCKKGLMTLTLFFALFALASTSARAAEGDDMRAGLCDPGELIVITHPGDETVIRCRPDALTTAPQSPPALRATPGSIARGAWHRLPHRRAHAHQGPKTLSDLLTAIFRPHPR